jgi:hypothetical protein
MFAPPPNAVTGLTIAMERNRMLAMTEILNRAIYVEARKMGEIRSIVVRFPQREFDIRRRCARDAHFESICLDYEEAASALRYWQEVAQSGDRKKEADRNVEEYANFLTELEAEILAHLNRAIPNAQQA